MRKKIKKKIKSKDNHSFSGAGKSSDAKAGANEGKVDAEGDDKLDENRRWPTAEEVMKELKDEKFSTELEGQIYQEDRELGNPLWDLNIYNNWIINCGILIYIIIG